MDTEKRFEGIFCRYFAPVSGPVLITAANVIGGAARIALAKPDLAERIVKDLMKVETAVCQVDECRNVALGYVIIAFDQSLDHIVDRRPVEALIKKQLSNTRRATRKKAEKFLEKHYPNAKYYPIPLELPQPFRRAVRII